MASSGQREWSPERGGRGHTHGNNGPCARPRTRRPVQFHLEDGDGPGGRSFPPLERVAGDLAGCGLRPDAVDWKNRVVRELTSDAESSRATGW